MVTDFNPRPGRVGVRFLNKLGQPPKPFISYSLLSVALLLGEITLKSFIFISYHRSCYLWHLHIQKSSPSYMSKPPLKKGWRTLLKKIFKKKKKFCHTTTQRYICTVCKALHSTLFFMQSSFYFLGEELSAVDKLCNWRLHAAAVHLEDLYSSAQRASLHASHHVLELLQLLPRHKQSRALLRPRAASLHTTHRRKCRPNTPNQRGICREL